MSEGEAMAALAIGQARCAVTGDAFQLLLQHQELFMLQTVMCSAVVFSRMQVHMHLAKTHCPRVFSQIAVDHALHARSCF